MLKKVMLWLVMSVMVVRSVGKVIVLDGSSSSGRSSISSCLKNMCDHDTIFVTLADVYHKLLIEEALQLGLIDQNMSWDMQRKIITKHIDTIFITLAPKRLEAVKAFYRHVKALTLQYRYVVVDTMFYIIEHQDLDFFQQEMQYVDVDYVLVYCSPEIIAQRLVAQSRLVGGRVIPNLLHICRMYKLAELDDIVDVMTQKKMEKLLLTVRNYLLETGLSGDAVDQQIAEFSDKYRVAFFMNEQHEVAIAPTLKHDLVVNSSDMSPQECAELIHQSCMMKSL